MKFAEMTFPQLHQVPRDTTLVLAPIAACEQHSLHLPTFTDTILVTGVAEAAERRAADQILLLPTQWFGASHHHLRFGATLSASVDTHIDMLCDLVARCSTMATNVCSSSTATAATSTPCRSRCAGCSRRTATGSFPPPLTGTLPKRNSRRWRTARAR